MGQQWNVVLRSPVVDPCTGQRTQSIITSAKPEIISKPGSGATVVRVCVKCAKEGVKAYELVMDNIRETTTVSDPITPPTTYPVEQACITCARERDGFLIFDKVELRAMGAYRGDQTAVFYPSATGGTTYEPKVFNFDRGGTNITIGGELALLWDVLRWNGGRDVLHLGVLGGVWPVDGSIFVPLSFHPRVTFNNKPDPYGCGCNAWYIFGDAGFVNFDNTKAPYTPLYDKRFFWGLGIGYEWSLGRDVDFGIDAGYRLIHTPLPPIDCCPQIPESERQPIRKTHNVFLRFGLTF
jgi:hypothetical protein